MAIVYNHIRKDTKEIFYVGIGLSEKRAFSSDGRNRLWEKIVNKHGFETIVTHLNICWEEACSIEKYLISFYGKINDGGLLSNITDGGEGVIGVPQTEETRRKRSESMRGENHHFYGKKLSATHIQNMSNGHKGISSGPLSSEQKEKISKAQKGIKRSPLSEDHKNKISVALKGKIKPPFSDEHKKKLSIHFSGKSLSDSTKLKMSEARKGKRASEETRKKLREAAKKRIYTEADIQKMKEVWIIRKLKNSNQNSSTSNTSDNEDEDTSKE